MNVEIIRVENEDILTLSGGTSAGKGKTMSWDDLGFKDPGTGNNLG